MICIVSVPSAGVVVLRMTAVIVTLNSATLGLVVTVTAEATVLEVVIVVVVVVVKVLKVVIANYSKRQRW